MPAPSNNRDNAWLTQLAELTKQRFEIKTCDIDNDVFVQKTLEVLEMNIVTHQDELSKSMSEHSSQNM